MSKPVDRSTVESFYTAIASRDPDRIAPFLADDVEWLLRGPVDVFPFCGARHGKAEVVELYRKHFPDAQNVTEVKLERLLVDGNEAAAFFRVSAFHKNTGRSFVTQVAHFLRFRDSRVAEMRGLFDTFDAAEQALGHELDLTGRESVRPGADLVEFPRHLRRA